VKKRNSWEKPHPTFYFIAANEKEALENANRNIKEGFELNKISKLGRQYGEYFFKEK
jgi:hypothetical protein